VVTVTASIPSTGVKCTFALNFKTGKNTLTAELFNVAFLTTIPSGQAIGIQVGGQSLDSATLFKQKGTGIFGKFTCNSRSGNITYATTNASQLQGMLAPFGAVNQTTFGLLNIPYSISLNGKIYSATEHVFYNAKAGKTGKGS